MILSHHTEVIDIESKFKLVENLNTKKIKGLGQNIPNSVSLYIYYIINALERFIDKDKDFKINDYIKNYIINGATPSDTDKLY